MGYDATLTVPNTPHNKLLNLVKSKISTLPKPKNFKILVKEDNGHPVSNQIMNSINPWPQKNCPRPACVICRQGGKSDCWKPGVTYQITCKVCQKDGKLSQYCGESARSIYTRGLEHEESLLTHKKGQPLPDHRKTFHSSRNPTMDDFEVKVMGKFFSNLPRLVAEGHMIDAVIDKRAQNPSKVNLMNSKTNFHQAKQIKVKACTLSY